MLKFYLDSTNYIDCNYNDLNSKYTIKSLTNQYECLKPKCANSELG